MRNRLCTVLLWLLIFFPLFSSAWGGSAYRWEDKDGNVHFTDDLTRVPKPARDKVEVLDMPSPPVSSQPVTDSYSTEETETEKPDPYAQCRAELDKETAKWTKQLEKDKEALEKLSREIHRTVYARKKGDLRRERVALKGRIEQAENMLQVKLPERDYECERLRP